MKITLHKILAFFIATMMLTTSCQKDKQEENLNSGQGTVTLKIGGTSFASAKDNGTAKASNSKGGTVSVPFMQQQEVSFNEEYKVTATLTPIRNNQPSLQASKSAGTVSSGPQTQPLPIGTEYTVAVYEKGNESNLIAARSFKHGQDDSEITFDLEPGDYTFLAFCDNFQFSSNSKQNNYLRWRKDLTVSKNAKLNLNILLEYILTEVTVTLNAGNIGDITSISSGKIFPNYNINKINYFTGEFSYDGEADSKELSFPEGQSGPSWTSHPHTLITDLTNSGEVYIFGISINGIIGSVNLSNITFEPGVRYDLKLDIGQKKEKTFKIGNLEFAASNLAYNESGNNNYFFAAFYEDFGDYFFPGYLKPKKLDGTNNRPDRSINGPSGDPCNLVKPLNSWRLPTASEFGALKNEIHYNDGEIISNKNAYLDFLKVDKLKKGLFIGTRDITGENRRNSLCLPLTGASYSSGSNTNAPKEGFYLCRDARTWSGYSVLQVHEDGGEIGPGRGKLMIYGGAVDWLPDVALSVRCVKN